MTKKELVNYFKNMLTKEYKRHENPMDILEEVVSLLGSLEPTISEVKEECNGVQNSGCERCKLFMGQDYRICGAIPDDWDIPAITKAIKGV